MNDQTPALILLISAILMFGAFDYYAVPWLSQFLGVLLVCGIPLIIIQVDVYIKRKQKTRT